MGGLISAVARRIPVRLLRAGLAALVLSGCVFTQDAVIPAHSAEDVGAVLQYWMWSAHAPQKDVVRLLRTGPREYRLQLAPTFDTSSPATDLAQGVAVLRLGRRSAAEVYLVQIPLARLEHAPQAVSPAADYAFLSYAVSVGGDGTGSVGTFGCDDPGVLRLAARTGLRIACFASEGGNYPAVRNRPGAAAYRIFFTGLLRDGLFLWEDETGAGVLDFIE